MDKNRFETQKEVVNSDLPNIPLLFTVEDLKWLIAQVEKLEQLCKYDSDFFNIIEELERLVDRERNAQKWLVEKVARYEKALKEISVCTGDWAPDCAKRALEKFTN